jgi:hypothetical protein
MKKPRSSLLGGLVKQHAVEVCKIRYWSMVGVTMKSKRGATEENDSDTLEGCPSTT